MNLLNKKWLNLQKLNVKYKENKILIKNEDKKHKFLIYPKLFKATGEKIINLKINGNLIKGTGCVLKILNRKKEIIASCGINSFFAKKYNFLKYYIIVIYVPGESEVEIDNISLSSTTSALESIGEPCWIPLVKRINFSGSRKIIFCTISTRSS